MQMFYFVVGVFFGLAAVYSFWIGVVFALQRPRATQRAIETEGDSNGDVPAGDDGVHGGVRG
jgi:hypothetical protein